MYTCTIEISFIVQLQELYQLLNENYVEDDDNMFRFDYSADFLLWCVQNSVKSELQKITQILFGL
jgi:hypothetical protein